MESTEVFQVEKAKRCFPGTAKDREDHGEGMMLISGCKFPVTLEEQVLVLCVTACTAATGHSICGFTIHFKAAGRMGFYPPNHKKVNHGDNKHPGLNDSV